MEELTEEQLTYGHSQTPATRRKIANSMKGVKNPAYKDGRRSYREKVGAKGKSIVHHKDGNRHNNSKSNLKIIPKNQRSKHDKIHNRARNFKK